MCTTQVLMKKKVGKEESTAEDEVDLRETGVPYFKMGEINWVWRVQSGRIICSWPA